MKIDPNKIYHVIENYLSQKKIKPDKISHELVNDLSDEIYNKLIKQ